MGITYNHHHHHHSSIHSLLLVFFELFDQDKDGYLSEHELTAAVKMLVELKRNNVKETESEETIIDAILTEHKEKLQVRFVKYQVLS